MFISAVKLGILTGALMGVYQFWSQVAIKGTAAGTSYSMTGQSWALWFDLA